MAPHVVQRHLGAGFGSWLCLCHQTLSAYYFEPWFGHALCGHGQAASRVSGPLARSHRDAGIGHLRQHARQGFKTLTH